jgi:hypothetical protein
VRDSAVAGGRSRPSRAVRSFAVRSGATCRGRTC